MALTADMSLKETRADKMDSPMDDVIASVREPDHSSDIRRLELDNTNSNIRLFGCQIGFIEASGKDLIVQNTQDQEWEVERELTMSLDGLGDCTQA